MRQIRIGKVALTSGGVWNASTGYPILTFVLHNGDGWWSYKANINSEPSPSNANWIQATDTKALTDALKEQIDDAESLNAAMNEAEEIRKNNEAARVAAEESRNESEEERKVNENERIRKEELRDDAETAREENEQRRLAEDGTREAAFEAHLETLEGRFENNQAAMQQTFENEMQELKEGFGEFADEAKEEESKRQQQEEIRKQTFERSMGAVDAAVALANKAASDADVVSERAERIDAHIDGTRLVVTTRNGERQSVDLKGEKGDNARCWRVDKSSDGDNGRRMNLRNLYCGTSNAEDLYFDNGITPKVGEYAIFRNGVFGFISMVNADEDTVVVGVSTKNVLPGVAIVDKSAIVDHSEDNGGSVWLAYWSFKSSSVLNGVYPKIGDFVIADGWLYYVTMILEPTERDYGCAISWSDGRFDDDWRVRVAIEKGVDYWTDEDKEAVKQEAQTIAEGKMTEMQQTFEEAEAERGSLFEEKENERATLFADKEMARQATFDGKEAERDAAVAAAMQAEKKLSELGLKLYGNNPDIEFSEHAVSSSTDQQNLIVKENLSIPAGKQVLLKAWSTDGADMMLTSVYRKADGGSYSIWPAIKLHPENNSEKNCINLLFTEDDNSDGVSYFRLYAKLINTLGTIKTKLVIGEETPSTGLIEKVSELTSNIESTTRDFNALKEASEGAIAALEQDVSDYVKNGAVVHAEKGVLKDDGTNDASFSRAVSGYIEIGDGVSFSAYTAATSTFAAYCLYKKVGDDYQFVSAHRGTSSTSETFVINKRADATHVRFTSESQFESTPNLVYISTERVTLKDKIDEVKKKADANAVKIDKFQYADAKENVDSYGAFEPLYFQSGSRIMGDTQMTFAEGDRVIGITLKSKGAQTATSYLYVYSKDGVEKKKVTLGAIGATDLTVDLTSENIVMSEGDVIAVQGIYYNNTATGIPTDRYYDFKSKTFLKLVPAFEVSYMTNKLALEAQVEELKKQIATRPLNVLSGKHIYFLGSSSTDANNGYYGEDGGYPERIGKWNGAISHNLGKSGYTLAKSTTSVGNIYDYADRIGSDADYVTIMIGANDIWQTDITYTDNGTDKDYISAYCHLLDAIITKCPMARIGLIIPYIPGRLGSYKPNYKLMSDAVKEVGKRYGIQVLDVGACGFNGLFDNDDNTMVSADLMTLRQAALCRDTSHLNPDGMGKMATVINQFVLGL